MKKIIKRGLSITIIYLVAVLCTFLVTDRVNELDNKTDLRNNNSSVEIKFSR